MKKTDSLIVLETRGGKLFQTIRLLRKKLAVEKFDFLEAKDFLSHTSPALIILNLDDKLDDKKEEAQSLVKTFSPAHPHTLWAVSSPIISTEELVEWMRLGVSDFLKQPVDEKRLDELIRRVECLTSDSAELNGDSHKGVSFFSSKGGVGVSFLAANLAVGMAQKSGKRVLLTDLVFQHGNAADLLDLVPQFTFLDVLKNLDRLDSQLLENSLQKHRSGLFVLPRPKQPEESELFSEKQIGEVLGVLKKSFHYVFLDLGHELDSMTIASLDQSDLIFTVMTPELPSLCNTSLVLQTFKKLGYSEEKVKLLLNRWHMKGEIPLSAIEENLLRPIDHKLPDDPHFVPTSINRGIPLWELSKNSPLVKSFEELIHRIQSEVPTGVSHGPA